MNTFLIVPIQMIDISWTPIILCTHWNRFGPNIIEKNQKSFIYICLSFHYGKVWNQLIWRYFRLGFIHIQLQWICGISVSRYLRDTFDRMFPVYTKLGWSKSLNSFQFIRVSKTMNMSQRIHSNLFQSVVALIFRLRSKWVSLPNLSIKLNTNPRMILSQIE